MPPIRRYLRITKYSVLECRIYLDNPGDANRWLLHPDRPVLPRVVEAVRPLVLPKLREENKRAKDGKGGKKKGWKDVVVEDDFEVAVFLTDISSRHSILKKEKRAKSEKPKLGTRGGKMTGSGSQAAPVEVAEDDEMVIHREEGSDEEDARLGDIPLAGDGHEESGQDISGQGDEERLVLSDDSDEGGPPPRIGTVKQESSVISEQMDKDDKKKMALNTLYDGFSIYGRILCLVVKRRGNVRGKELVGGVGQAMMEEWIASTQREEGLED